MLAGVPDEDVGGAGVGVVAVGHTGGGVEGKGEAADGSADGAGLVGGQGDGGAVGEGGGAGDLDVDAEDEGRGFGQFGELEDRAVGGGGRRDGDGGGSLAGGFGVAVVEGGLEAEGGVQGEVEVEDLRGGVLEGGAGGHPKEERRPVVAGEADTIQLRVRRTSRVRPAARDMVIARRIRSRQLELEAVCIDRGDDSLPRGGFRV
uniref:Uncharacterized protein n=1 Tax=Arcella intermedia TaxID=1963864 RepID=A0A6B2LHJ4_9EUKA